MWEISPEQIAEVEILPAASGAPEVFFREERCPVSISLSHRAGIACCAAASCQVALGCDMEKVENRGRDFEQDYFTEEEQQAIIRIPEERRALITTLIWSGKESALKALQVGLRSSTKSVSVSVEGSGSDRELVAAGGWYPLKVCFRNTLVFRGGWYCSGEIVRTLIMSPLEMVCRVSDLRSNLQAEVIPVA